MEKVEIKDMDIQRRTVILELLEEKGVNSGDFYIQLEHLSPPIASENYYMDDLPKPIFGATVYKYCVDDNSLYLLWNIGPEETY